EHAAGGVPGNVDPVHRAPLGKLPRRHVRPGPASVPRDVDEAVVAPGPQHALLERRFLEGRDRVVDLGPGVVSGDRTAGRPLLRPVVPGQGRADHLPALPRGGGAGDELRRVVGDARIVGGDPYRSEDRETVAVVLRGDAFAELRVGRDVPRLARR